MAKCACLASPPHLILARLVVLTTPSKKFRNRRSSNAPRGVNRMDCAPIESARTRGVAQVCCGVVSNVCCDVSARVSAFSSISVAPVAGIDCTTAEREKFVGAFLAVLSLIAIGAGLAAHKGCSM